jgi:DNA repair protein RadD
VTFQYHPFQDELDARIDDAQAAGALNVLAVSPMSSGKTVMMARRALKASGASICIAHRSELISQMSLALARAELRHRVIGPSSLVRQCVAIHMAELQRSFYDPLGRVGVAGVDALIRRPPDDPWFFQIGLWQTDEAHHLLANNKWGQAVKLFPHARGIGWTATPVRADGKGLGRGYDGLMDTMVEGPQMRWLIDRGYMCDYRVFCPVTEDLHLEDVGITASGDYSPEKLRTAVHQSRIVGDVVKHYLRIAPGKLGVTFAVDIEDARKIAAAYREAGVSAEIVTSETPDVARFAIMRRFRSRQVLQLVNVDLFGEGFDLPAIEVVSMARPTASYTLYAQQFGRVLRRLEGKQYGIIIDHVGNVLKHGLPDRPRTWTMARREGRGKAPKGDVPGRACPNCTRYYERLHKCCPFCKWEPEPAGRSSPDQVDGDLMELDPAVLALMRAEIERVDGPALVPGGLPYAAQRAIQKTHLHRQQHQAPLRAAMDAWAYWREIYYAETPNQIQRRFFFTFGVDVMTARTLNVADTDALLALVQGQLDRGGVVVGANGLEHAAA